MEFLRKEITICITFLIKGKLFERVEEKFIPEKDIKVVWYGNDDETEEHKKMKIRFMTNLKSFDDKEEMYQNKHEDLKIIEEEIDSYVYVNHNGLRYRRDESVHLTRDTIKVYWNGNGYDINGFNQIQLGKHKGTSFETFIEDLEKNYQELTNK